jgi:hypothetical protein
MWLPVLQIIWIVGGVCAFIALVISSWVILNHLVNYTTPSIQRPMVRLLIMVPIYAVDSSLALMFKNYALYFDLGRDCYEAWALYTFLKLMEAFMGGDLTLIEVLESKPPAKHPAPLGWCGVHFKPGTQFLQRTRQMILQFAILRPLCSLTAVVLQLFGLYDEGSFSPAKGYLYLTIINNVSVTLALYYLVLFYHALAEDLKPYKPVLKFLAVKAVIFFSFWQGVAIAILSYFGLVKAMWGWDSTAVSRGLQDLLICVEMVPLAFMFAYAFGPRSFFQSDSTHLLSEMKGMHNVVKNYQVFTQNFVPIIQNFADVADVRDVFGETYATFARTARKRVMVADFLKISKEEQLARVLKHGWLYKRGLKIHKWGKRYFLLISKPMGLIYYESNPFAEEGDDPFHDADHPKAKDLVKKVIYKKQLDADRQQPLPVGFIDFAITRQIRPHTERSLWTFWEAEHSFCVETTARPWFLKAHTPELTHAWLQAARQALDSLPPSTPQAQVWQLNPDHPDHPDYSPQTEGRGPGGAVPLAQALDGLSIPPYTGRAADLEDFADEPALVDDDESQAGMMELTPLTSPTAKSPLIPSTSNDRTAVSSSSVYQDSPTTRHRRTYDLV